MSGDEERKEKEKLNKEKLTDKEKWMEVDT